MSAILMARKQFPVSKCGTSKILIGDPLDYRIRAWNASITIEGRTSAVPYEDYRQTVPTAYTS